MTLTEMDLAAMLQAPGSEEEGRVERLAGRLAVRAEAAGTLDVVYRHLDSPVGTLLLAATRKGLVRVAYPGEGQELVLGQIAQRISPRILPDAGRLDRAARELEEYFAGRRRAFELALDLELARGFRRTVLERLLAVGYGDTVTYSALAAAAGSPRAVRAVGSACATNPIPIVVPCHRVLRRDGGLGGYGGGLGAKSTLLALEGSA